MFLIDMLEDSLSSTFSFQIAPPLIIQSLVGVIVGDKSDYARVPTPSPSKDTGQQGRQS